MSTLAQEPAEATFDISGCPRCNSPTGHEQITFRAFRWPFLMSEDPNEKNAATHWATCPTTGEPILFVRNRDDVR